MRPNQTFQVLEAVRHSVERPLYRKGIELSLDDSQTVMDVYQQWLLLFVDLGYLPPDELLRGSTRLFTDMVKVDVLHLNNSFAEGLHLVRMQSHKGFKALCSEISSHLFPLIREDWKAVLAGNVFAAKRLVQLFSYTSRLSLKDIDLTQQLLDDYRENEDRLSLNYDTHTVRRLNSIIKRWIGPYAPEDFHPQHGPGGVAGLGRCSLEIKYKNLSYDHRLTYAFGSPDWCSDGIRSHLDRISKTIFVPKSYKTFRTISMEPATLQYFQQSVWKHIDRRVAYNPYLRNHIGFHDQERNKSLACSGSINRDFATIDLSAASDSVSYELVKQLFRGTWLQRYFLALRSTHTLLPDGSLIKLKKFAPMGSALCFPIETIIFASICELVTRNYRVSGDYSVFGDDIIVPTQCVESVIAMLKSLDFLVNREKSFYQQDCWFRESCGGEYCDGFDVTPMRVSRSYNSKDDIVKSSKLVDMANMAYSRGYRNLRYFFIAKMRALGYTPLFAPTSLQSDNYTNYHAQRRWNPRYQRIEVEATHATTKYNDKARTSQSEVTRYRHWLESTAERVNVGDGFESIICRPTVVLQDTWFSKPYECSDQAFIDYFQVGENPLQ